jgi:hypothetical protein
MTHPNDISRERLALVQWTARVGAVTAEALALREGCTLASARGRLLSAGRAGLLMRRRPLTDRPALYAPTRAGLRAVGMSELDPTRISASNACHAAECAAVAVALERAYPDHRVMGERELRAEERRSGSPRASSRLRSGPGRGELLHRPDLVLWPSVGSPPAPIAVEVELTVKAPARLREICLAWARCRCVEGVLYICSPEVQAPLERAIAKASAGRRIVVVALARLECHGDGGRVCENHPN